MCLVGQETPEQSLDPVDFNLAEDTAGHTSVQVQTNIPSVLYQCLCQAYVSGVCFPFSQMLIAFSDFAISHISILCMSCVPFCLSFQEAFVIISMEVLEEQEQSEEVGEVDSVHSEEQHSSLLPSLEEKSRNPSKRQRKTVSFEPVRVNLSLTSSLSCRSPVWLIFCHEKVSLGVQLNSSSQHEDTETCLENGLEVSCSGSRLSIQKY